MFCVWVCKTCWDLPWCQFRKFVRVRGSYVRIGGDGLKWTRGHMLTPIFCPHASCLLPATTASLLQLSISLLLQNCLLTVQLFENCLTVVKTCESATGTTLGGSLINHRGATLARVTYHTRHSAAVQALLLPLLHFAMFWSCHSRLLCRPPHLIPVDLFFKFSLFPALNTSSFSLLTLSGHWDIIYSICNEQIWKRIIAPLQNFKILLHKWWE